MREVSIVGLDLAKRVFQVHGTDTNGGVVFRGAQMVSYLMSKW